MKCNICNTENRDIAIYCKHCGNKLEVQVKDPFNGVIGRQDVKNKIGELLSTIGKMRERESKYVVKCDTIVMGASGTGKNCLAEAITKALYTAGVVKHPKYEYVDAYEWDGFVDNWDDNMPLLKDKVLVIDNVQKLVREDDSYDIAPLDRLFKEMEEWHGNPIVILLGLPSGFREFIDKSPEVRKRFANVFKLNEYDAKELTAIVLQRLMKKHSVMVEPEAADKLERVIMHLVRNKPDDWGNAHTAIRMADDIYEAMVKRGGFKVQPQDIVGKEEKEKTPEEIMSELDEFVGIENVRREIRDLITQIEMMKERTEGKEAPKVENHYVFSGNPGTGKTTVARKMGNIFKAMGVLPLGHLIEADRSKLVSNYVGQTAIQTNELIDKAMGGVLLIDEAYTLNQGDNDTFGHEAIDTLLKRMEDDRGKFVCIVAGYSKQMFDFIQSNPGLQSRFNAEIKFEDYDGASLTEIFRMQLKQRSKNMSEPFVLDADAERNLRPFFNKMYEKRDRNFGNARDVRKTLDKALARQSNRLNQLKKEGKLRSEMLNVITRADIEGEEALKNLNEDEIMAELDQLVGLDGVKKTVHALVQTLQFEKMRAEVFGLKMIGARDHYLFLGNPGTGKTTVARIMAKVFKALGAIQNEKIVEVDRSKMVAQYVGQSAPLTNKVVDSAMGGLLFIDEAYTLIQSGNDTFGQEAVDTLLKRLEDDRGKFICIAAGYTREMQEFINSNSGLESRFNVKVEFEDYGPEALAEIFRRKAKSNNYVLLPDADAAMVACVQRAYDNRGRNFGNARAINNIFDKVKARLSDRVMQEYMRTHITPSEADFTQFKPEDFNIEN